MLSNCLGAQGGMRIKEFGELSFIARDQKLKVIRGALNKFGVSQVTDEVRCLNLSSAPILDGLHDRWRLLKIEGEYDSLMVRDTWILSDYFLDYVVIRFCYD